MGIKQAAVISTVFSLLATATERACRDRAIFMPHALLLGSEADTQMLADAFAKVSEHRSELAQRRRAVS
jgi:hypothetical protein